MFGWIVDAFQPDPFSANLPPDAIADPSNWVRGDWIEAFNHYGQTVTVRFKPDLYAGRVAVHCHVLFHGDFGQMGILNVTNGCDALCRGDCKTHRCDCSSGSSSSGSSSSSD